MPGDYWESGVSTWYARWFVLDDVSINLTEVQQTSRENKIVVVVYKNKATATITCSDDEQAKLLRRNLDSCMKALLGTSLVEKSRPLQPSGDA